MKIDNIRLSACAYFYKLKDGISLSLRDVQGMLCDVTTEKKNTFALNLCRQSCPNGCKFNIELQFLVLCQGYKSNT